MLKRISLSGLVLVGTLLPLFSETIATNGLEKVSIIALGME